MAFQAPEVWGFTTEGWQARLEKEAPWLAAVHEVQGPGAGTLWLLFAQVDSQALAAQMASAAPPAEASVDTAVHRAAQAMGVSALSAMGRLTGLTLSSGEPVLRRSALGASSPPAEEGRTPGLVLEVRLRAPSLAAQFLLVPAAASVGPLLHSLRV